MRASTVILNHEQELLIGGRRFRFEVPAVAEQPQAVPEWASNATRKWESLAPSQAGGVLQPAIVEISPGRRGQRFPLREQENWLGRDRTVCTIVVDDPMVDRRHAADLSRREKPVDHCECTVAERALGTGSRSEPGRGDSSSAASSGFSSRCFEPSDVLPSTNPETGIYLPPIDSPLSRRLGGCAGGGTLHRVAVHGAHRVRAARPWWRFAVVFSSRRRGASSAYRSDSIRPTFCQSSSGTLPVLSSSGLRKRTWIIDVGLADAESGFEARLALLEQLAQTTPHFPELSIQSVRMATDWARNLPGNRSSLCAS